MVGRMSLIDDWHLADICLRENEHLLVGFLIVHLHGKFCPLKTSKMEQKFSLFECDTKAEPNVPYLLSEDPKYLGTSKIILLQSYPHNF
jgi:hypothetical protein